MAREHAANGGASTHRVFRTEQAPLALLELPTELLVMVLMFLDSNNLARFASTCTALFSSSTNPVSDALRQRAAFRGHASSARPPEKMCSSAVHLAWLERRYIEERHFAAGGLVCSFFVSGGRLLSCGYETRISSGLLGQCHINGDIRAGTRLSPLSTMEGIGVNSVGTEFGHGTAVSVTGDVYTWGTRHLGRRGPVGCGPSPLPMRVSALAAFQILSVSTGSNHCLAVAVTGQVFSWGISIDGLCGHGSGQYQDLPRQITSMRHTRVRSASAGTLHSLVVAEDGSLFSFGRGAEGQLGHRGGAVVYVPRKIRALGGVRIRSAAAGGFNSLALAADGTVFAWGSDRYGESDTPSPQRVDELMGVVVRSIVARGGVRCALSSNGEVYTWGRRSAGLLGHGNDVTHQPSPRRVDALRCEWVSSITFGSVHTIVVTREGGVLGWGHAVLFGLGTDQPVGHACASSLVRYTHVSCVA